MEVEGLVGRTLLGRFRIDRILGRGGMATVYAAFDHERGTPVALKVLKRELTRDSMVLRRFAREAKAASNLQHPNVVEVLDWGVDDEEAFISMELAQGVDLLKALSRQRPMKQVRAVLVLSQVCAALSAAHAKGIVHRDLKPENVLLVADTAEPGGERAKVLDFGIAKLLDVAKPTGSLDDPPSYVTKTALTRVGTIVGTPAYMSPEQCRGGEIDGRSDVYACGVLLYQLVTGELPFTGETPLHTAMRHIHAQPRPVSELRRDVAPQLERVISKALAKWPGERQQSAEQLRDELLATLPHLPDRAEVTITEEWLKSSASAVASARPPPAPGFRSNESASSTGRSPLPSSPPKAATPAAAKQIVPVRPMPSGPLEGALVPPNGVSSEPDLSNPTRQLVGGPLGATPLRAVRLTRGATDAMSTSQAVPAARLTRDEQEVASMVAASLPIQSTQPDGRVVSALAGDTEVVVVDEDDPRTLMHPPEEPTGPSVESTAVPSSSSRHTPPPDGPPNGPPTGAVITVKGVSGGSTPSIAPSTPRSPPTPLLGVESRAPASTGSVATTPNPPLARSRAKSGRVDAPAPPTTASPPTRGITEPTAARSASDVRPVIGRVPPPRSDESAVTRPNAVGKPTQTGLTPTMSKEPQAKRHAEEPSPTGEITRPLDRSQGASLEGQPNPNARIPQASPSPHPQAVARPPLPHRSAPPPPAPRPIAPTAQVPVAPPHPPLQSSNDDDEPATHVRELGPPGPGSQHAKTLVMEESSSHSGSTPGQQHAPNPVPMQQQAAALPSIGIRPGIMHTGPTQQGLGALVQAAAAQNPPHTGANQSVALAPTALPHTLPQQGQNIVRPPPPQPMGPPSMGPSSAPSPKGSMSTSYNSEVSSGYPQDALQGLKATARLEDPAERGTNPMFANTGENLQGVKATVRMNPQETMNAHATATAVAQAKAQAQSTAPMNDRGAGVPVPSPSPSLPSTNLPAPNLAQTGWNEATIVKRKLTVPGEKKEGLVSLMHGLSGTTGLLIGIGLGLGIAAGLLIVFFFFYG